MTDLNEFNVVIWYPNDTYEYFKRYVSAQEAVETAHDLMRPERPGVRLGAIAKVMITDGGDLTVFLWENGKGIVFPTQDELQKTEAP